MSDRTRKPPEDGDEPGVPLYMLSFGDMMTNLLCFFILLCAFANEQRMGFISDGLGAFRAALLSHGLPGLLPSDRTSVDLGAREVLFRPARSHLPKLLEERDGVMDDGNRQALREVVVDALRSSETTDLPLALVFTAGSSDLSPSHRRTLAEVAPYLAGGNFNIRIAGYAYDEGKEYAGEWHLAWRRARAVAAFLVESGGIEPQRLLPVGHGPTSRKERGGFGHQRVWGRRIVVLTLVQS